METHKFVKSLTRYAMRNRCACSACRALRVRNTEELKEELDRLKAHVKSIRTEKQ